MMQQQEKQQSLNAYFEGDLLEIGRQILLSRMLAQETSLSDGPCSLSVASDVLDLACGVGGWMEEITEVLPRVCFTGLMSNALLLEYAQAQAWARELKRVQFRIMDITQPLLFEDASFDLIRGQFLLKFLLRSDWPQLVRECLRLLHPGGCLLLGEGERWSTPQASALTELSRLCSLALWRSGQTFSSDDGEAISMRLHAFLEEGGYEATSVQTHCIDISYGSTAYPLMLQNVLLLTKRLLPFLEQSGVGRRQDLEILSRQAREEVRKESFQGYWYMTQVQGRKPV